MVRAGRWDVVVDKAAELFARNGFAATSVREVAAGAALSKAGLYYHIREKEDLLYHICQHSIAEILKRIRAATDGVADPAARLGAIIRVHIGFFADRPHNLTVLNRQRHHLPPSRRAQIVALERDYLDLLRGTVGETIKGDATVASFLLLSMLNGLDGWYDAAGRVAPDALASHIEHLFLDGMRHDQQ